MAVCAIIVYICIWKGFMLGRSRGSGFSNLLLSRCQRAASALLTLHTFNRQRKQTFLFALFDNFKRVIAHFKNKSRCKWVLWCKKHLV